MDRYSPQLVAIRALNDELRTRFRGGRVAVSDEVRELGDVVVAHAFVAMAEETAFDDGEHRSGRFVFLRAPVSVVDLLWRLAQSGPREDHEAGVASLAVTTRRLKRLPTVPPCQTADIRPERAYDIGPANG